MASLEPPVRTSPLLNAGEHRWQHAREAAGMATVVLVALATALRMGALTSGFSGADEPSHYLNIYLIWAYVTEALGQNPLAYAKAFYVHYPKISIGHWPPLYYALMSPMMFLLPHVPAAAFAVNVVIAALPALIAVRLLTPLVGAAWAVGAGLWIVTVPVMIEGASFFMVDQAIAAVALVAAFVWSRFSERPSLQTALLYGGLCSVAILIKGDGWLLGLVPVFHMALTGRWRLALDWRSWAGAAAALVIVLPWTLVSYKISADGFNYDWGLGYTATALLFFSGELIRNHIGPAATVIILVGAVAALRRRMDDPVRQLATTCLALALATLVFHALVPVDLATRYMVPAVPPLCMLGAIGAYELTSRLRGRRAQTIAGAAILGIVILPGVLFLAGHRGKVDLRMDEVAADVVSDHPMVLVIDGSAGAEGALIAEVAIRDLARTTYVVRSSDLLASSDFMAHRYTLRHDSPAGALDALRAVGASAVIVASSEAMQRYPHSEQLTAALNAPDSAYRLAKTLPHGNRTGETRLFRLERPLPVALPQVRAINLPDKAPDF